MHTEITIDATSEKRKPVAYPSAGGNPCNFRRKGKNPYDLSRRWQYLIHATSEEKENTMTYPGAGDIDSADFREPAQRLRHVVPDRLHVL